MTEAMGQLNEVLHQHGQKSTATRRHVFKALQGKEPQTIQEIYNYCKGNTDRSSVYRTITLFEQLGIIKRLQIGWKYKLELSDDFHHHHHHLTCLGCGKVIPLGEDEELEKRFKVLSDKKDFQVTEHQLEIQGYCKNCQK
jgi:Fur family ferric uptake transcriptional regulator